MAEGVTAAALARSGEQTVNEMGRKARHAPAHAG